MQNAHFACPTEEIAWQELYGRVIANLRTQTSSTVEKQKGSQKPAYDNGVQPDHTADATNITVKGPSLVGRDVTKRSNLRRILC